MRLSFAAVRESGLALTRRADVLWQCRVTKVKRT
jgi:hypothetical protein